MGFKSVVECDGCGKSEGFVSVEVALEEGWLDVPGVKMRGKGFREVFRDKTFCCSNCCLKWFEAVFSKFEEPESPVPGDPKRLDVDGKDW